MSGFLTLVWAAFLLAELGLFIGAIPVAAGAAVFFVVRRRLCRVRPVPRPAAPAEVLAVATLALGVAVASIPPGEMILGGSDPGVYVHTAAGIARHGSLAFPAEDLAAQPPAERRLISRDYGGLIQPFPGMFVRPDGRIAPSFHHLYPALLAVAYSLAGVWGALLVNPLLAAAAPFAAYALARRLLPAPWSLAAPLAMALNPALLWQAKFPTSELLAQLLLVTGAAFLVDALDSPAPPARVPLLAGACLGLALLARYESLLLLVPLVFVLAVAACGRERRRSVLLILAPLAALAVHAVAHTRFVGSYYVPLGGVVGRALSATAAILLLTLAVRLTPAGRAASAWLALRAGLLRGVAAAVLAGWAAFAWWVRPGLGGEGALAAGVEGVLHAAGLGGFHAFLAGPERGDFLYLRDIFATPGLIVALTGTGLALRGATTAGRAALAFPAVGVLVFYASHVLHDHALMWVLRRFVPVAVPLLAVGIAVAAACADSRLQRFGRLAGRAGGAAVLAAALVPNLGSTLATARAREWPGLVGWFREVAQAVPEGAVVLVDRRGLAAPLRFIHGVRAYEYRSGKGAGGAGLPGLLRRRLKRGESVFLLTREKDSAGRGLLLTEQGRFPLRSSVIGSRRHGVPRKTVPYRGDFVLYRVERTVAAPPSRPRGGE